MATCHLCPPDDDQIDAEDALDHIRVMHPEVWEDGPARWPDGSLVVVDCAPEPREVRDELT